MIVVFGSINLDLIVRVPHLPAREETVLGGELETTPGGKGANQALAARRAGADVHLVGCVGRDTFAAQALAELRAGEVDLSRVTTVDASTGVACIAVDPQGDNQIVVAAGANARADAAAVPDSLLGPETTLLLQMEVPAEQNWRLIERANAAGARVVLNVAPAAPVPRKTLEQIDVLVMNRPEAMVIAGKFHARIDDLFAATRPLAEQFSLTAVITLGDEGARAITPDGGWNAMAMDITPLDTVGAGDAFVGVLAAMLDSGGELPRALHLASVAGGLACQRAGAQPSLPTLEAIEAAAADLPRPLAFV